MVIIEKEVEILDNGIGGFKLSIKGEKSIKDFNSLLKYLDKKRRKNKCINLMWTRKKNVSQEIIDKVGEKIVNNPEYFLSWNGDDNLHL